MLTGLILFQEAGSQCKHEDDQMLSALDEDDFQTIIVENKLGCDMYLKKIEENSDVVQWLPHSDCTSVWIPPPRFLDRVDVADGSREARYYVTVQIIEAKVVKWLNSIQCNQSYLKIFLLYLGRNVTFFIFLRVCL